MHPHNEHLSNQSMKSPWEELSLRDVQHVISSKEKMLNKMSQSQQSHTTLYCDLTTKVMWQGILK